MTALNLTRFRLDLKERAEPGYARFSRTLTPTRYPILGVRIPILRKWTAQLLKEGIDSIPLDDDSSHEEILMAGMMLGHSKVSVPDLIHEIDLFLCRVDNWAACDMLCTELKRVKRSPKPFREFILPLFRDSREFYVRFAEVLLLDYYIQDEYMPENFELYSSVCHPGYYAQMGAAWGLSACYIRYPEETENFLWRKTLSPHLLKMTLRKIRESNRVSKNQKEYLRSLFAEQN